MNKSYDYIDGKVILQDKTGKKHAETIRNNTYDIVRQENLVETIDDNIKDLEREKKNAQNIDSSTYTSTKIAFIALAILGPILTFLIIPYINYIDSSLLIVKDISPNNFLELLITNILKLFHVGTILDTTFLNLIFSFALSIYFYIPIGLIGSITSHIAYKRKLKESLKEIAGYDNSLEYLKSKKQEAEQELKVLRSESRELSPTEQDKEYREIPVDETYQEGLNNGIDSAYHEGVSAYKEMTLTRRKNNKKRRQNS